jgi:outer membrane protein TolC
MKTLTIALGLAALLHATEGHTQVTSSPDSLPPLAQAVLDSALATELASLPGAPLSLEEALGYAVDGAIRVRLAGADSAAARGTLRYEQGTYDPELYGELGYRSDDVPTASFFSGADVLQTDGSSGEAGLRWTAPLGTELSASLSAVRSETNSDFALLSPQYDAIGELRVTQPLLDGFGVGQRGQLTAAEHEMQAAEARLDNARLGTQAQVESLYWELYAVGRDYTVQRTITERAQALLQQAETRSRAGVVGPADVANAKVFLAQQQQAELDAQESLGDTSDRLASLIGYRPPHGEALFKPTDEPPADYPVPTADELVLTAEENNLELRGLQREVEARRALFDQAKRNALPSLDAYGALGGTGLSGTPQEVDFGGETFTTEINGNLGDGLSQVLSRDYPSWRVGLTLTVPIFNRTDGGEKDRLAAELVRSEQRLEEARRLLETQVRTAQRALANGRERLDIARFGVTAAQEQVRIGVLEYENGRTSAFELVRLGGDLASAQQRYSRALVRTARAVATLRQLTGGAYPSEETKP